MIDELSERYAYAMWAGQKVAIISFNMHSQTVAVTTQKAGLIPKSPRVRAPARTIPDFSEIYDAGCTLVTTAKVHFAAPLVFF